TEPESVHGLRGRLMTAQRATLNGGGTDFQGVNRDDAAANTATSDLIDMLNGVDIPIVVLGRDCVLVCFNEAAADLLRLSPSDVGRASRDISALAGLPRLEEQCNQGIASGIESRADFRDGDKWCLMRTLAYTQADGQ